MTDEFSIGSSVMSSRNHGAYLGGTLGESDKAYFQLQIGKSNAEHLSNTYQTQHTQQLTRVIDGREYTNSITLPHFQTAKSEGMVVGLGGSYKPGDPIADNFNFAGINKVESTEITAAVAYNLKTSDAAFAINGGLTFSSDQPLTTKFSFDASPHGANPAPMVGVGDIADSANEISQNNNPYGGTLANTRDILRNVSLAVVTQPANTSPGQTDSAALKTDIDTISSEPAYELPSYIKTDLGLTPTVDSLSSADDSAATIPGNTPQKPIFETMTMDNMQTMRPISVAELMGLQ